MSGSTINEGYPYPLESDFADVQDAFRLASAIDTDLHTQQGPFRAFMGRPSFIGRQSATGSGFVSGTQNLNVGVIEWDNTGGLTVGSPIWNQPYSQQPSWWMFGATLLVNIVSGTPVVNDLVMGQITVNTTDATTGVLSESDFYQRNDESNTNGEWINMIAMAPIFQGYALLTLNLNGSTQKAVQSGSRFWGMYLGPVS